MKNPCRFCPDRKAECKITCEKWKEYEAEYFKIQNEKEEKIRRYEDFSKFKDECIRKRKKR